MEIGDNDAALATTYKEKINVLDRKLAAIGEMNGEGMKRLFP